MLSVDEALGKICEAVAPFPVEQVPLGDALGLTLAAAAISDIDSPPFDKALMDGFAIRTQDGTPGSTLEVLEEVTAGCVPTRPLGSAQATLVMTGAPVPDGTDAVVPIEKCEYDVDGRVVTIRGGAWSPGTNVLRRGTTLKRGQTVLDTGVLLTPQGMGALAEAGQSSVSVRRRPRVAVLATGDELVGIDEVPGPGQIRNSNATMLAAQIVRAGGEPVVLGIARDNRTDLDAMIAQGLESDLLLLSGGVSAGKLDLVPEALEAAGVRQVFHKIRVKPGKPLWFGVRILPENQRSSVGGWGRSEAQPPTAQDLGAPFGRPQPEDSGVGSETGCFVFGLPGNPVSSMVCFELFVRTALRRLRGDVPEPPVRCAAHLVNEHVTRGDRPVFHPARLDRSGPQAAVEALAWHGSADLQSTARANAMICFPAGERTYRAGDVIDVICW